MGPVYKTYTPTAFAMTTGAKTILKLISTTGFHLKIYGLKISFDGVTSSAIPALVEWGTSDETTAGTSGVTPNTNQIAGRAQSAGITAGSNFTAEGTTYTVVDGLYVPQFMGIYEVQFPLGLEIHSPGDAADSFFLRANVTANVNARASITWGRG